MTFDEIASIYIYTTDSLYYPLNKSLRKGQNDWSPFAIVLISALNKLPLTWSTLYRGTRSKVMRLFYSLLLIHSFILYFRK